VRQSVDLDLRIAPESKNWLRQAVPLLARVSVERQRDELFRILSGKQPATALRVLDVFGALNQLLPELAALRALEQPPPHRYDAWEHTFQVAQKLGGVLNVLALEHNPESAASWALGLISLRLGRFRRQVQQHLEKSPHPDRPLEALLVLAALYHDSGKAETRQADQHGRVHFYRHEEWSERLAILRANQLRLSNLEAQRLGIIVRHHMRPFFLAQAKQPPSRRAIYRFFRDCGEAGVDVCLLSLADSLATYGPALPEEVWISHIDTVRALLSAYWETKEEQIAPPVLLSGHDLLEQFELSPGPHIGELLEALREAQAMGDVTGRLQALQFVEEWLERSGKNS
jgi:tRNA nucleotidyltransferase/poly(A) polymerase